MFKNVILIALLAVIAVGGRVATVGAQDSIEATVELRVWQRVSDPLRIDLSARPAGGRWGRTERLPMAETSASRAFRYTDRSVAVPVAGGTASVELRVWQRISDPSRVYLSARPAGGAWGRTERLPMAETNARMTFRYTDRSVSVPLPAPEVTIVFWGEFSEERQAEIRDETLSVVNYFANRYGLLEPDFELHVGADVDSLTQARRDVLDIPSPSPLVCGKAVNERVFIFDWCATATHDLTSPLAHEYFHVLQAHLAAGASEPIAVADWLLEGTAEYVGIEYSVARGDTSRADAEDTLLKAVTSEPFDLQTTEAGISQYDLAGYYRAAFATSHLIEQTGETAMLDFFRALPRLLDWREAFAEVFGRTTEEFYADFASFVQERSPGFAQVVLKVLDPDGNHLSYWNGLETRVTASSNAGENASGAGVAEDRSAAIVNGVEGFHFAVPEGAYNFSVALGCQFFDVEPFGALVMETIARHPAEGSMPLEENLEVIVQLPGWPSELNIHCSDRDRYPIRGVVVSSGDHDLTEYRLSARPIGIRGSIYLADWEEPFRANADGAFEIPVPDGYGYRLFVQNACLVEVGYYASGRDVVQSVEEEHTVYSEDGTHATSTTRIFPPEEATVISVDGAGVDGIRIQLPEVIAADEWNDRLREVGVCSP